MIAPKSGIGAHQFFPKEGVDGKWNFASYFRARTFRARILQSFFRPQQPDQPKRKKNRA